MRTRNRGQDACLECLNCMPGASSDEASFETGWMRVCTPTFMGCLNFSCNVGCCMLWQLLLPPRLWCCAIEQNHKLHNLVHALNISCAQGSQISYSCIIVLTCIWMRIYMHCSTCVSLAPSRKIPAQNGTADSTPDSKSSCQSMQRPAGQETMRNLENIAVHSHIQSVLSQVLSLDVDRTVQSMQLKCSRQASFPQYILSLMLAFRQ